MFNEMNNCLTYLPGCGPIQEISIIFPISDLSKIKIYKAKDCEFGYNEMMVTYSLDQSCWACYMDYYSALSNTADLNQDFFVNIKVNDQVYGVTYDDKPVDYSTQLAKDFNFAYTGTSSNLYNPYANMSDAIGLQQTLNEAVSEIAGIPIYYFKLSPNKTSKDITFKEYTLMDVDSVKQLKLIIPEGQMPSSRPEFAEFGLEWQTDWECEITKSSFATAFGNTAQPMEGDLIYIPMMKRMWMVNEAYEEKNGGLMWVASTFKLLLVKYQEKGSVDLGDMEMTISSFVKNKYEDLFGEDDFTTLDSGFDGAQDQPYVENNLYAVYESDATRKYVTCDTVSIYTNESLYYKGTLISDSRYKFMNSSMKSVINYQKEYCGDNITLSFIFNANMSIDDEKHRLINIGKYMYIQILQNKKDVTLSFNKIKDAKLTLKLNTTYFVVLRYSRALNLFNFAAYEYVRNENVPIYKLNNVHYWFNIDSPASEYVSKYNVEFILNEKQPVEIHGFNGWLTNIKVYDMYIDNLSEILQMYPTNQHLLINDTAKKLLGNQGVVLK